MLKTSSETLSYPAYPALLKRVRAVLIEGQRRVEAEKIRTYWETGRHIQEDIRRHLDRSDYGKGVIRKLSRDLDVGEDLLYRCVRFFQAYPGQDIFAGRRKLTWSHYRQLAFVPDEKERKDLENTVEKFTLSDEELRRRIQASRKNVPDERGDAGPAPAEAKTTAETGDRTLLVPKRGQLYAYKLAKPRVVSAGTEPLMAIDAGFSLLYSPQNALPKGSAEGDIVVSELKKDRYIFKRSGLTSKDIYTYQALVERVVDGDTLRVLVDLGFRMSVRQILRLRGINCPELGTKAGDAAKAFVRSLVKETDRIVLRSFWSDKYGRYLADVFVANEAGQEACLNNILLEKGHAVRMG